MMIFLVFVVRHPSILDINKAFRTFNFTPSTMVIGYPFIKSRKSRMSCVAIDTHGSQSKMSRLVMFISVS